MSLYNIPVSSWVQSRRNVMKQRSALHHPRMLHDFRDGQAVVDISVQHSSDQVDAVFREWDKRNAKGVIQDLVDIVKRILLVDNRVKKDSKSPDVLLFAAIGFALQDFGCSVI